jgi:hypothetical protein
VIVIEFFLKLFAITMLSSLIVVALMFASMGWSQLSVVAGLVILSSIIFSNDPM